jgi:hypothetical protein
LDFNDAEHGRAVNSLDDRRFSRTRVQRGARRRSRRYENVSIISTHRSLSGGRARGDRKHGQDPRYADPAQPDRQFAATLALRGGRTKLRHPAVGRRRRSR